MSRPWLKLKILGLGLLLAAAVRAEDGYQLWLRYAKVQDPQLLQSYRKAFSSIVVEGDSDTDRILRQELQRGFKGLLGKNIRLRKDLSAGALLVGTPSTSPLVAQLKWDGDLQPLGNEGYLLRSAEISGRQVTVIASLSPVGCLYGSFRLLRLLGTQQPVEKLDLAEKPRLQRRILDHWDNLDGTIERGYAGKSLWKWDELPGQVAGSPMEPALPSRGPRQEASVRVDDRVTDYARACASVGLNGSVLNNVNSDPRILTTPYLEKVAALAAALRPYGLHVYLSANPGAPKAIGGLPNADPLDPAVVDWWKQKADEIYRLIPDFGGFLVKANSEGQPGPQDYGRTHADGANCLARALAPHGGVVMWRAFVYRDSVDPDRIKRSYKEFKPLDGKFDPNVFVQVKYGPLDFQPREPFHPLFGGVPKTQLCAELQITQEYLGHSNHLVYLGPVWKEFLESDTYEKGPGSTVEKVVDGSLEGHDQSAIAGVANTGDDRNWCGHPFAAANWYAFGRLAWDPSLNASNVAEEWTRLTWTNDAQAVSTIVGLMMGSREAYVDYTCPLGLAGVFEKDLHYAPDPGMTDSRHADWSAAYYNRADGKGLGFDRTRSGSDAVDQYHPPLDGLFNGLDTCPEQFLLWFHHVSWDHPLKSGKSLWDELCLDYQKGVGEAQGLKGRWELLQGKVDPERWKVVEDKLTQQVKDAGDWRDKCLGYFQGFSKKPIPRD